MRRVLLLGVLVLGGCSSGPEEVGVGQDKDAACAIVYEQLGELDQAYGELPNQDGEGDQNLPAMVDVALVHLDNIDDLVQNKEVADAWRPISELQRQGLEAALDGNEEEALGSYMNLAEEYESFWDVCPDPRGK